MFIMTLIFLFLNRKNFFLTLILENFYNYLFIFMKTKIKWKKRNWIQEV